jgi:DNA polymerase delta subunit 1
MASKVNNSNLSVMTRNKIKIPDSVTFMAREWFDDDRHGKYIIYIFGCTEKGESVCIEAKGFTPYFFMQVPNGFRDVNGVQDELKGRLYKQGLEKDLYDLTVHKKKNASEFTNDEEFSFIRFKFSSIKAFKKSQWILKELYPGYRLFETKGVPMLVMTHIRNVLMSGWMKVDNLKVSNVSRCQICASTKWTNIHPVERIGMPPFVTLSYDLECFSRDGLFPDPYIPDNYITQIGNILFNEKTKEYYRHIFVVGQCDDIDGTVIDVCRTESDLILKWIEFVVTTDPDQIIGYNIDDFDWQYIWRRADLLGLKPDIGTLSRLRHVKSTFSESSMESSAFGFNKYDIITTPGIGQIDMLHWFRKNKKLRSYKLDFVSELYLGEKKHNVDHKQIFKWSGPNGSSSERKIVAEYCIQDTYLPVRLMQKFDVFINLVEMSKVSRVPLTWLITRGESVKVYSQVSYTARSKGYLIPDPPKVINTNKFEGATVLDPKYGAYNEPVCGMDFASLYPSIMIALNLDLTTYVKDKRYMNIPGVVYRTFKWDGGNYTFVQNRPGLLSGIQKDLWSLRKEKKKLMNTTSDPELKKIYNATQLAYKLCMNSIYGGVGSPYSALYCKPISACVTYNGRMMIDHSKKCAMEWYAGAKNGYSDSLPGNEIVYVKNSSGKERKIQIKNLGKSWKVFTQNGLEDSDKLQGKSIYKIKSRDGWADVERVIKHKTSKKVLRITTSDGSVCVTEDHPMILEEGKILAAKECKVGDVLLTSTI